jgi:aspartyl-tRNA(Asn)/glutamyl-tRNA(Gln) amidotransferase subunit A
MSLTKVNGSLSTPQGAKCSGQTPPLPHYLAEAHSMSDSKLLSLSISELAPLIRQRKVSPVEVTQAVLDRAETLGPRLASIITLLKDEALAQARAREEDIARGGYRGPLDGVPVSVKDNIATAGIRTTMGVKVFDQFVPDEDAFAVAGLKQAGAVIYSKDNLHELAGGNTTDNPWYGRARNPWNLECSPGGSSGGTGANVAARISFAGIGTDAGGSVRNPSAQNGLFGIKATAGRVSTRGLLGSSNHNDYIGPIARTPRDVAYMLQAISGYDMLDPNSVPVPVPDFTAKLGQPLKGMRAGIPTNFYFDFCDDEVEANFYKSVEEWERLGVETTRVDLPMLDHADIMRVIGTAEGAVQHEPYLREQRENISEQARIRYLAGQFVLARDYIKAMRVQYLVRQEFLQTLQDVDFILAPSRNVPATPPGAKVTIKGVEYDPAKPGKIVIGHNLFICNMTGLPSLAAPSGFTKIGLPTGLLLIGRPFDEATLLQIAHAWDEVRPSRDLIPPLLQEEPEAVAV